MLLPLSSCRLHVVGEGSGGSGAGTCTWSALSCPCLPPVLSSLEQSNDPGDCEMCRRDSFYDLQPTFLSPSQFAILQVGKGDKSNSPNDMSNVSGRVDRLAHTTKESAGDHVVFISRHEHATVGPPHALDFVLGESS